jgi:hypothetical protein
MEIFANIYEGIGAGRSVFEAWMWSFSSRIFNDSMR